MNPPKVHLQQRQPFWVVIIVKKNNTFWVALSFVDFLYIVFALQSGWYYKPIIWETKSFNFSFRLLASHLERTFCLWLNSVKLD